jgi:hypothetical protein
MIDASVVRVGLKEGKKIVPLDKLSFLIYV